MIRLLTPALMFAVVLPLPANEKPLPDAAREDPLGYWAERLPSPDAKERMRTLVELGNLGPKAAPAVPAIADRLEHDKDARVRLAAAGVLGKIGPEAKAAVPALIGALKDKGFDVSHWSASALGEIGPAAKEAVPALTEMVGSYISSNAYTATRSLGKIGPDAKSAVPTLLRALKDNPHYIRADVALALWRIEKHKDAIPSLMKMLEDSKSHGSEVYYAADSLAQIGPEAKEAVPLLLHALRHDGSLVGCNAALALWQIDKHKNAIPFLIDRLGHSNVTERGHAAQRLEMIGPPAKDAIPALTKVLGDDPIHVGQFAKRALKAIDPVAAKKAGVE